MQDTSLPTAALCATRKKLFQHLKAYEIDNLMIANLLAEINTLSDEKKRDLKILEACACTLNKPMLSVLLEKLFLSRDPGLQNAMQNLKVNIKVTNDKHNKITLEICIGKLNAADLSRLTEAFRGFSLVVKDSSSKGNILPFLNSYIKTELTIEKLLKLLPALINDSVRETIMADLLASVDNAYQRQSTHMPKRPGGF